MERRARRMLARGLWRDVQRQRMFLNEAGKELGIKEVGITSYIYICSVSPILQML